MKKTLCFTLTVILFQLSGYSQKRKNIEYSGFFDSYYYRGPLSITLGGGTGVYSGDLGLAPGPVFYPAFGGGIHYRVWPRTYFGIDFNYLNIGGKTKDTSGEISFSTTVYETILYCRFNLIDKRILFKNDINKRPQRVRPYITLGFGASYYEPSVSVSDTNFFKNYEEVNAGNIALVIPASLGFAFYLSKRFSILTEFGYRYAFSDGLDRINKKETEGPDSYGIAMLKLQYSFYPYKKRRAKYIPPVEGSGGGGGSNNAAPVKKDSTLNDPILPPGAPAGDSTTIAPPSGSGEGQITPPAQTPASDQPKELTEEEKRKQQEEKEQLEWEQSAKPKSQPADKKKSTKPAAKPKPQEDTGGW